MSAKDAPMALRTVRKKPTAKQPARAYRRVVVKAGTNVLTNRTEALDIKVIESLISQMAELKEKGGEVLMVTSGAIAAGKETLREDREGRTVSGRQMLAAVGQSRLMHLYQDRFSRFGITVAQALLTRRDVEDRLGYLNVRNTLERLLEKGVVPIINENDVVNVEEVSQDAFGDNDQLSALVANLIDADLLLMLTDTAGLHTSDPNRDPSAELVRVVEQIDNAVLAQAGTHQSTSSRGGMRSKLEAARLATSAGVTVIIAKGTEADVIGRAARGEAVGTLFPARVSHVESRKRWMLSGMAESGGAIEIDAGAATALNKRGRSLLPAGVKQVRGQFQRGDLVSIVGSQGERVACGISNYDGDDLRAIMGARSQQIIPRLGHHYGDEVVHRNNMVVL